MWHPGEPFNKARVVSGKSFEILYSLKANDWPFGNVSM
jgi:hypothetical protein